MGRKSYQIGCVVGEDHRYDVKAGILWLFARANYRNKSAVCYGVSAVSPCSAGKRLAIDVKEDVLGCDANCLIVDARIAGFCNSVAKAVKKDYVRVIAVTFEGSAKPDRIISDSGIIFGDKSGIFSGPDGFTRACEYALENSGKLPDKKNRKSQDGASFGELLAITVADQSVDRLSLEAAVSWVNGHNRVD